MITSESDIEFYFDPKSNCVKSRYKNWSNSQPQTGQARVYMENVSPQEIVLSLQDAYDQGRSNALSDLAKFLRNP